MAGQGRHRLEQPKRRRVATGVAVAGVASVFVLSSGTTAFADNVVNDVVADINTGDKVVTIVESGSATVSFKIVGNSSPGTDPGGCDVDLAHAATVTIAVASGATVDSDSVLSGNQNTLTFTACNVFKAATFTSTTAGTYAVSTSVSGGVNLSAYNTNGATFDLQVNAASAGVCDDWTSISAAAPTIDQTGGTTGSNGWWTSAPTPTASGGNGTLLWGPLDDGSSTSLTATPPTLSEGTHTVYAWDVLVGTDDSVCDSASSLAAYKVDSVAPGIAFKDMSPAANGNGWNNSSVTVRWDCTDATSLPVDAVVSDTKSDEGAHQTANGVCYDNAGNSASANRSNINIDLSDPTNIAFVGSIDDGDHFPLGQVPSTPTCTADDQLTLSGLHDCTVSGYETTVGSHILRATATDNAGNSDYIEITYTVDPWTFAGFYSPVDNDVLNTMKSGATAPIKFELFVGDDPDTWTEWTDTTGIKLTQKSITCAATGVAGETDPVASTSGATVLRYDTTSGQFVYNWQSPKNMANTCWAVTIYGPAGSQASKTAYFKLTK